MLYPSSSSVSLVIQFPSESRLKETQDWVKEQRAAHLIRKDVLLSFSMTDLKTYITSLNIMGVWDDMMSIGDYLWGPPYTYGTHGPFLKMNGCWRTQPTEFLDSLLTLHLCQNWSIVLTAIWLVWSNSNNMPTKHLNICRHGKFSIFVCRYFLYMLHEIYNTATTGGISDKMMLINRKVSIETWTPL